MTQGLTKKMVANLKTFQIESNRLEKVDCYNDNQLLALVRILFSDRISINELLFYLNSFNKPYPVRLRDKLGDDLFFADYQPPLGGIEMVEKINNLILLHEKLNRKATSNYLTFMDLMPFTELNGIAGRSLWLRQITLTGETNLNNVCIKGFTSCFHDDILELSRC